MEEISVESQEAKIRNFERGYRATHVINMGLRLGIFQALHLVLEGMTVKELSLRLMLHEPYLEVLGIESHLDHVPTCTHFTENNETEKAIDSPLTNYIRTGRSYNKVRSQESSRAASEATKGVYQVFLSMILPTRKNLERMLKQGIRFLDIGCGSGNLIIQLAHAFSQNQFVGVDPDIYGIERAESTVSDMGLENRISFEIMGAEELHYNNEFEMVCMVATLHEILPAVRAQALEKAYGALKKEGQLLVLDFPYPDKLEDFRNTRYDYGVIEQYFEVANGIVHLSASEQNQLLDQVGFKNIQRMDMGEGMFDFITATK
jgi:ubiquinone/menaquinone biosynthesis C-methylase UbiE